MESVTLFLGIGFSGWMIDALAGYKVDDGD